MKTHENRALFSRALLKATTCLFLTAGAGVSSVWATPETTESMRTEMVQQQTVTVSGVVKDRKGEPIIGANIMETGTTNGKKCQIHIGCFLYRLSDSGNSSRKWW